MKIDKYKKKVSFQAEDGEFLDVEYDNRGEPYREGISMSFNGCDLFVSLFIEGREAKELRDLLLYLYPPK